MKLEFKILWLDDKMNEFIEDDYHQDLKNYLADLGFKPTIITTQKESDFFNELNDTFDLIMCDFHLSEKEGETRDGDQIVAEVRGKSIFTEILFYSARGDVKDTYKLDRITFVETRKMQQSHQEALIIRAKKLIDLIVGKFQHIVSIRGMIMHETSTLDSEMLEIIKKAIKGKQINFDDFAQHIYDEIIHQFNKKIEFVEECKKKNNFNQLTKDTFVYSATYKIKTLSQILSSLGMTDFSADYQEKINNVRNKFAHAVLENDGTREFFKHGETGMEFTQELCKEIRVDINTHLDNIMGLKSVVV